MPGAEQALAAGKLLTRVRDGRLRVLFEADDADNALRDIHGTTLLNGLRVVNPYFANFTEAPVASGWLVLYGNQTDPRGLDPRPGRPGSLRRASVSHRFRPGGR